MIVFNIVLFVLFVLHMTAVAGAWHVFHDNKYKPELLEKLAVGLIAVSGVAHLINIFI